ncbi:MAG TPA: aldehyde ferredoxin oxidoreductase family protein, partial [Firmicutes bacterium]|nr:aldehyde ferredoxin oxidoreductase family protein [Bacillota bacterium]
MPAGYSGRILRVDLSTGQISAEEPGEKFYRTYMGGKGFAAHFLWQEVPAGTDPFAPENVVVLAGSVVSGLPIPGYSRFTVAAKSPLTGGYGEAEAGGYFAPELKFAGYEAVVIRGVSASPVYLYIHDGQAELRDASHLWGLTTSQTEAAIRTELGDARVRVACIGPAGENLVRYACVLHEGRNAAGRCGLGAVMGSKRLKAVAVRGTNKPELADREGIMSIARFFRDNYLDNPLSRGLHLLGTDGILASLHATGMLPTRNFSRGSYVGWEGLSGETYEKEFVVGKWGCYACPIRCKRTVRPLPFPDDLAAAVGGPRIATGNGDSAADATTAASAAAGIPGPEYETIAAFGSNLESGDLGATILANRLCNELGLDTISTGVTLSFAAECFERGLLTAQDTGGVELRFGDVATALRLLPAIARRKGFGDLLAEGSRRLAAYLDSRSPGGPSVREPSAEGPSAGGAVVRAADLAVQVKGLEAAMHDPRGKVSVGLGYALAAHGADHMVAAHDTMFFKRGAYAMEQVAPFGLLDPVDGHDLGPAKVRHFAALELWWDTLKVLGICFFTVAPRSLLPARMVVDSVRYATGWETSLYELMLAGERANTLVRLFNLREGIGASADGLPPRFALPNRDDAAATGQ